MHSRADNNQINVSVTKKIGEIYIGSNITYIVRPISVYTEFLQTEIFQPEVLATGHCHNRFMCDAKSGISKGPEIYG